MQENQVDLYRWIPTDADGRGLHADQRGRENPEGIEHFLKVLGPVETERQLSSLALRERIMVQSDPASNGGVDKLTS